MVQILMGWIITCVPIFTVHYMQYSYSPSTGYSLIHPVVLVLQTPFSSVFGNHIAQVKGCDNMNNKFWRYKRAHWANVHIFFLCIYFLYATYFRLSKCYNRSCWITYPIKKKKKDIYGILFLNCIHSFFNLYLICILNIDFSNMC